ncbi:tenascin-N isoform X3 [Pelodiscus sinensis]|uniref:tenascin-N isoform X3 n=1 Tax=Pelodiscus sinensis TaxID=13735 RepID=UPI003F6C9570
MSFWRWLAFPQRVLLYLALQTTAAQLSPEPNCTSNGQKISFSHSYKIDLPKSSQLQVEADPLPLKDDSHVLLAAGGAAEEEEQNIIFRHNIRVQTPRGDCEALGHIRDLLGRVEKMEKEMLELKEACSTQRCCGGAPGVSNCSGHGTFIQEICGCDCEEGWEGSDCSRPHCPNNCHGHGRCVDGRCLCSDPYVGEDCGQRLCPANCSGNGVCSNGVCQCYEEFIAEDCSEKRCPNDCSGNGFCDSGECYCHDGFIGLDCSQVVTPQNVQLLKTTEDSLTFSWDEVPNVDYYLLSYYPIGHEASAVQVRVPKGQLSYEILGLRPSTKYQVALRNVKKGISSNAEHLQARTALSAVSAAWVTEEMEDSLEVEWENPPTEPDYFKLRYSSLRGQEKEVVVPNSNDPKSRYIISGLKPGTEYNVTVVSVKDEIEGKPSTVTGQTGIDSPTNLETDRVTEDTATISWNRVLAPIDRYMVSYTSADGDTRETAVGKDQSSTTLTGLKPGMEYVIHIWAEKGGQQSKRANTKAVTDIDSPTNLVTDGVTEDKATISWKRVQAPIDRYVVSYTSVDGDTRETAVGKDKSITTLTGLKPGMEYVIYIWAEKRGQQSRRANTKAVTEIDPPKNLRVSDVTQSSGIVTWMPPAAQINGYTLTYQAPNGTSKEVQLGPNEQRFTLEGLEQGVRYTVYVMAFKGDRRSRKAASIFSTVGLLYPYPADCSQTQQNGNAASGMYTIYLNGDAGRPLQVFCDMATDGGGWIVFQRRNTGQLDFYKRWRNYVEGFGDPLEEFWLGLDKLHNLTSSTPVRYEIRVDLRTSNDSAYAVYDSFQVASSRDKYKLSVGNYRGTAGDALTYHNGWKFTTWDRDNDVALSNCARSHHGAWWYKNCHLANLNGKYGENKHSEGVNWAPWKGHLFSIPYTEMKIRPQSYSSEPILGRKKRSPAGKRKKIRA